MSVQADEQPDGEEEREFWESEIESALKPATEDALDQAITLGITRVQGGIATPELIKSVRELLTEGNMTPLEPTKYVARLMCGCTVSGITRAANVRLGSHGQHCEEHDEFSLFEDIVLARPVR